MTDIPWSKKHTCCTECKSTQNGHHGLGLCHVCYTNRTNARSAARLVHGAYRVTDPAQCQRCQLPFQDSRPYYEAGICYECFRLDPLSKEVIQAWRQANPRPRKSQFNPHRAALASASRLGATTCAERVGVNLTEFRDWCAGADVPIDFYGKLRELYIESRSWIRERF